MLTTLALTTTLILSGGVFAQADPGVLEAVALKRARGETVANPVPFYGPYSRHLALIGVADCSLVGQRGVARWRRKVFPVFVVDCEHPRDRGQLKARGLLADVNKWYLCRKRDVRLYFAGPNN